MSDRFDLEQQIMAGWQEPTREEGFKEIWRV